MAEPEAVRGGGETHKVVVTGDASGQQVEMHSTPKPLVEHIADYRLRAQALMASQPARATKALELLAQAHAIAIDIDSGKVLLEQLNAQKKKAADLMAKALQFVGETALKAETSSKILKQKRKVHCRCSCDSECRVWIYGRRRHQTQF